jgi:hypothetical protein
LKRAEVQHELKLSEEQVNKWREGDHALDKQADEEIRPLRKIPDAEQRHTKWIDIVTKLTEKKRSLIQQVLSHEQRERLNQIRLQMLGDVYALSDPDVASKLSLSDEQKQKLAEIQKALEAKAAELRPRLWNLSQLERIRKGALFRGRVLSLLDKADGEALRLLSAEQKEEFQKIKGKKFELEESRGDFDEQEAQRLVRLIQAGMIAAGETTSAQPEKTAESAGQPTEGKGDDQPKAKGSN